MSWADSFLGLQQCISYRGPPSFQAKASIMTEPAVVDRFEYVQVAKLQAAALAEDPSIFDYDSHFDAQQQQKEASKPAAAQARKSRYIETLLDKNKERQREQDIIYERKLVMLTSSHAFLKPGLKHPP